MFDKHMKNWVGWKIHVKGAGGSEVDIRFLILSIEENASYQELFRNEKIFFLAKVIAFSNLENTYNYIARPNFNRNSPKINFKISYSF